VRRPFELRSVLRAVAPGGLTLLLAAGSLAVIGPGLVSHSRHFGGSGKTTLLAQPAPPSQKRRTELPGLEFVHPLEGPVHISGSFGEYRKFSRYHHGLDYKTFNRNGLTVRTPLAGVVERVHVSKRGYGNGLFLLSPGGIRTTYGHLNDFLCPGTAGTPRSELEDLRRAIEFLTYGRGVFIKIPPWFRFQSGECIARSGESGSGAPHLHFEVQKNGRYIDPLFLRGMEIPDTTAPTMLSLYIEDARGVQRLPVRLRPVSTDSPSPGSVPSAPPEQSDQSTSDARRELRPVRSYYALEPDARLEWQPGKWVRYMVGGYDTMAARNRNGVQTLALSVGGRQSFRHELDAILHRDLARSGRVYHTARTVIGREYVYLLYDGSRNPGFPHRGDEPIRVILGDASGNEAVFEGVLPAGPGAIQEETANSDEGRPRAKLQTVFAGRGANLEQISARGAMKIRFEPRSLHEDARAGLSVGEALSSAARKSVRIPPPRQSRPGISAAAPEANQRTQESPVFQLEGPVFRLEGRDLFYRNGARAEAWFQTESAEAAGTVALYMFNETVGRWLLVAYPYREADGRAYYRFPFRYEGSLAQLRDLSPPRILQPSLWAPPTLYNENKNEIVREFMVIDRGSGFSRANTQVLLDGRPMPFQWIPDRATLQVRLPPALIPGRGVLLSIRAADHSGNRSPWLFDFIAAPSR
jgi:murein DD-endopeptidase MepM/ murein hydrolase activator NlpD